MINYFLLFALTCLFISSNCQQDEDLNQEQLFEGQYYGYSPISIGPFGYLKDGNGQMTLKFMDQEGQLTFKRNNIKKTQITMLQKSQNTTKSVVIDQDVHNTYQDSLESCCTINIKLMENGLPIQNYACDGSLQILNFHVSRYSKQGFGYVKNISLNMKGSVTDKKCVFTIIAVQLNLTRNQQQLKRYEVFFSALQFIQLQASILMVYKIKTDCTFYYPFSLPALGIVAFSKFMHSFMNPFLQLISSFRPFAYLSLFTGIANLALIFLILNLIRNQKLQGWTKIVIAGLVISITCLLLQLLLLETIWYAIIFPVSFLSFQIHQTHRSKQNISFDKIYIIGYLLVIFGFSMFRPLYIFITTTNNFFLIEQSIPNTVVLILVYLLGIGTIIIQHYFAQKEKEKEKKKKTEEALNAIKLLYAVEQLLIAAQSIPKCGICKRLVTFNVDAEIKKILRQQVIGYVNTSPLLEQDNRILVCKPSCGCIFHLTCLKVYLSNCNECPTCHNVVSREISVHCIDLSNN